MNDQERDEHITRIDTNVGWLIDIVGNHLQHHSKLLFWGLGVVTTIIVALVAVIFSLITK